MPIAWGAARTWRLAKPVKNHVPMPAAALRACPALALGWGWWGVAAILGLAFLGLLRPAEALRLRAADVLLPSQLLGPRSRLFIVIRQAKTSRVGARHQYVRVDGAVFAPSVEALLASASPAAPVCLMDARGFRARWGALMGFFGICARADGGLTPASMRAGGATWLFGETQNIEFVRWTGRWLSHRTLEHYLQEVTAAGVLPCLAEPARARVARFVAAAAALLEEAQRALRRARCAGGGAEPQGRKP